MQGCSKTGGGFTGDRLSILLRLQRAIRWERFCNFYRFDKAEQFALGALPPSPLRLHIIFRHTLQKQQSEGCPVLPSPSLPPRSLISDTKPVPISKLSGPPHRPRFISHPPCAAPLIHSLTHSPISQSLLSTLL
ncbi:unnamed protein product [Chondrus crispus]|uniref:Uncharacterized protein n=1 Tax=Chondrus crispus TaxID=2769 RepID=R7QBI5_CHOCR|nr:unnamed protein product [Chondrus crispus]CDF35419.1 unnamed protein product [Chondrus crispus]|eukprot:XP_005715238.1 unnamed protein product [Chondrus crispus]